MFDHFECCNGLHFFHIPMVGYFESTALYVICPVLVGLIALFVSLARGSMSLTRAFHLLFPILVALLLMLGLAVFADSLKEDNSVKGWLSALDMASVDDESTSLISWIDHMGKVGRDATLEELGVIVNSTNPELIQVISEAEAKSVATKVKSLSDLWLHHSERAGPLPAFTFGAYWMYLCHSKRFPTTRSLLRMRDERSSVRELTEDGKPYNTKNIHYEHAVPKFNKFFTDNFGDVYDSVLEALSMYLSGDVEFAARSYPSEFDAEWGLPGFNIHLPHMVFTQQVFQAHVDGDYNPIVDTFRKKRAVCDAKKRMTFTLSLETFSPETGLDYYIYDQGKCSLEHLAGAIRSFNPYSQKAPDIAKCMTKKRLVYKPGHMMVHSGALIHAVGNEQYQDKTLGAPSDDDRARITMQGFSCYCDDKWTFFW